jgi:hypothetical protein
MSVQTTNDDLSTEIDHLFEKTVSDLKRRLTVLISRREKRLVKQMVTSQKTSRTVREKPDPIRERKTTGTSSRKNENQKKIQKYHSSSSDTDSN